jgi:hypothetical protein
MCQKFEKRGIRRNFRGIVAKKSGIKVAFRGIVPEFSGINFS